MAQQSKSSDSLANFHPAVAEWFTTALGEPTSVQSQAWESIQSGKHTLIAAPTGSGKTLAAFLSILNELIVKDWNESLLPQTSVLYISPLKALSNDVEKNLNRPLSEIQNQIFATHLRKIDIKVAVRTGDTPASERASMIKHNPHILISTPESLFLLLTSKRGRDMLKNVRTLIVDEIHALVADKRGAHLALSLERLQSLVDAPLQRIGLSATQKPIEAVAQFLTGMHQPCTIIDSGHRRRMDLQIEIPDSPLTAVMANEVWDEVYNRIELLIENHTTTLIFVNTRRLAERVAHRLSQSLGEEKVAAHHGSLSKDRRFSAEQRLKAGELKVLVATASLELGIDIGSVDLVIQIANPKSISAFLQRMGRSGHAVNGLPKGRIFPLTRDELMEATALLDSVRRGELDMLIIPDKPLDILAQQIVAETAAREWQGEALFQCFQKAYPYRDLTLVEFQEITHMLGLGFTTRRGRRGAHLHVDLLHDRLRARPGARLTALTNGGAIPDTFDYDVKLEPGNTLLGSVNEDFAIDSMAGDIFQLGNNSWQILRIEGSTVRVADAHGQPPTIPFWFGEAPGRSEALSTAVSRVREEISDRLGPVESLQIAVDCEGSSLNAHWRIPAVTWLVEEVGVLRAAADQMVDYMASVKLALGVMPSRTTLVLERFFDDAGDMHMIVHSPFGSRINRAWGLSLRKRFCRKFNFELQAAATEEGLILSLGATHSFPLDEVFQYLRSSSVRPILIQALLDAPMFEVRWRWNATRALALQRNRNGKKIPPQLQRMAAEDLVALVFPDQKACFENIQGEREVPDHPLVRQTIEDCLHEAMDITGLEKLLGDMEAGRLTLEARDLKEPSPLSQEIINARPYAFLDDAPLEERRTRAIQSRRYLDPTQAGDLGRLDPEAIRQVKNEAWPQARNPDELHDALMLSGYFTSAEIESGMGWRDFLTELVQDNRVGALIPPDASKDPLWFAIERWTQGQTVFPNAEIYFQPDLQRIDSTRLRSIQILSEEDALVELIRGRMESQGPITVSDLSQTSSLPSVKIELALLALEHEGFVLRGQFNPDSKETQWCERRLLARIHRYSLAKLRREIEPVSSADFIRFLFSWQGLQPRSQMESNVHVSPTGPDAMEFILSQLEGYEAPSAAWEQEIFPARMPHYDSNWLDLQGLTGHFTWGHLRTKSKSLEVEGRKPGPIKTTPIAFLGQENLDLWLSSESTSSVNKNNSRITPDLEPEGKARIVLQHIQRHGASFWREILWETGLTATDARDAIAELVSMGWLTSDGFRGLRTLIQSKSSSSTSHNLEKTGRWSLLRRTAPQAHGEIENPMERPQPKGNLPILSRVANPNTSENSISPKLKGQTQKIPAGTNPESMETFARVLLKRYGVVFRKLADKENLMPAWRDLIRAFRTLEARGEIRGGRFVEGYYGEQFALPESLGLLRSARAKPKSGIFHSINATDPVNLQGILTPGPRIPASRHNRILFKDGEPVAVLEGEKFRILSEGSTLFDTTSPRNPAETKQIEWERLIRFDINPEFLTQVRALPT